MDCQTVSIKEIMNHPNKSLSARDYLRGHIFKRIKRTVSDYIISVVTNKVSIGGHCGLCGNWVNNILLPSYWRITICQECIDKAND